MDDVPERLHLVVGDTVLAIETARGMVMTPYDPDIEQALVIGAKVGRTYRNALRELAK